MNRFISSLPLPYLPYRPAPIRIGNHVWLGANVTVLAGVSIGDNAVVAAGAMITEDGPPGALAAGVPARVIRPDAHGQAEAPRE